MTNKNDTVTIMVSAEFKVFLHDEAKRKNISVSELIYLACTRNSGKTLYWVSYETNRCYIRENVVAVHNTSNRELPHALKVALSELRPDEGSLSLRNFIRLDV